MASTAKTATTRSQPARQSRTAPPRKAAQLTNSRIAASVGRNPIPTGSAGSQQRYPAIYAFTDALEALPLETVRNFTLLREVDAKACLAEENVRRYIKEAISLPPAHPDAPDPAYDYLHQQEMLKLRREESQKRGEMFPPEMDALIMENPVEQVDFHFPPTRRSRMYQVRIIINDLLPTLDEKIHVITTTNDTLTKHLGRLENAFESVENEIPEIHRRGNLQHWAYKPNPPRGVVAQRAAERAERQAQAERDHSELPHRSDSRREGARRGQMAAHDDDDLPLAKRAHGNNRAKAKEAENATSTHKNGDKDGSAPAAPKKRRTAGTEKVAAAGKAAPSPRSGTPSTTAPKKTTKGSTATGGAAHRKRAGNSSLNSPVIASPELGALSEIQRIPEDRVLDSKGAHPETVKSHSSTVMKSEGITKELASREIDTPTKELALPPIPVPVPKGNRRTSVQDEGHSTSKQKDSKKATIPPSPKTTSKKSAPTPINTSIPTSSSHRPPQSASKRKRPASPDVPPTTNTNPRKKSHTPTQSQSATSQMAPILPPPPPPPPPQPQTVPDDSGSEETDPDPDEPRYCICNGVSYGQMVACDSETCEKEWFHLECVGLAQAPKGKAKWFCQDCIAQMNSGAHSNNGRRRR
ncbi:hypothetical protein BJ508DRAFT_415024 [Ascobolus immersus RN42]|uniref:Chromatin modification-related protein n=1 Tax=Ascobolus immersus RN42 TaxID=1160509 RepID=A0A3N4I4H0_ASCIM|nr:hypothetical protein BJ508DRAFT_415024 [Ascobolus immersus RN42]